MYICIYLFISSSFVICLRAGLWHAAHPCISVLCPTFSVAIWIHNLILLLMYLKLNSYSISFPFIISYLSMQAYIWKYVCVYIGYACTLVSLWFSKRYGLPYLIFLPSCLLLFHSWLVFKFTLICIRMNVRYAYVYVYNLVCVYVGKYIVCVYKYAHSQY